MNYINSMTKISRSNDFIRTLAQNKNYSIVQPCKIELDNSSDGICHLYQNKCYSCTGSIRSSNHGSVIFKGKIDECDIISYGKNKFNTKGSSIHAEADAINNLQPTKRRKLISVDILVIKIKRDNKLSNS